MPDPSLPHRACDTHLHVFGPPHRYPGSPERQYSPIERPYESYQRVARRLGVERAVLVQPSAYGRDNRCLLDTLRAHGGTLRGVVVIDPAVADYELETMHALGVRGARVNLMNPRVNDGGEARRIIEPLTERIARFGWHLELYADPDVVSPVARALTSLSVPVVLDHCAGAGASLGIHDRHFAALVDLYADGGCWVKLSGADLVAGRGASVEPTTDAELGPAAPFMHALIEAGTSRLVWGTDWPHLFHFHGAMGDAAPAAVFRPVDDDALVRLLRAGVRDDASWRRILVENPARLYGFD